MRKLAIAVVALLVLLVAADRIGVYVAERQVADTLQKSQHLQQRPSVDIAGFPFLTQLLGKELDQVTITAHGVPLVPRLQLRSVQAVMHDVKINFGAERVTISHGTATALLSYRDLSAFLGVQVGYAGDGRIHAAEAVTVAGRKLDLGLTASPRLLDGALAFGATKGDTGVDVAVLARLADKLGARIDLSAIPFGLSLQSIGASSAGIVVKLSGRDVTLQKGS
jgi:hypothetical protein